MHLCVVLWWTCMPNVPPLEEAHDIFYSLCIHNVVTQTTLIVAYTEHGVVRKPYNVCGNMRSVKKGKSIMMLL